MRNLTSIFDPVDFEARWFQNEITYLKCTTVCWSGDDWSMHSGNLILVAPRLCENYGAYKIALIMDPAFPQI